MNWEIAGNNLGIILIILWEVFWKAVSLWRAAKRGEKLWFMAILLINLFGIIPLFYLWRTKQLQAVNLDFQNFLKHKFKK